MAITAETRQDIMELVVTAYNAAPGTTLLSELVALSESGSSLKQIADTLADSATFKATYPTFQTATEFATEFLNNLVPEASAAAKAEGVTIIEGMLNGGSTRGDVILEAATYLAAQSESHVSFGTSAALFNNRVEVATYHTITSEAADAWAIPSSVTSSDATVAVGTAAVDTALTPAAPTPAPTPTFSLAADSGTVSEGATSYFTLTTTNVAAGTQYSYTITGVSADDVSGGTLAGTATVDANGKAVVAVTLNADATTEGSESLTMSIAGESLSVSVTDSSTTPATVTTPDPTFSLAANAASVNEGETAYFTLTTTNVASGTEYSYQITGVEAADVQGGTLAGTATVGADGKAIIAVTTLADTTTEGAQTLSVAVAGESASVSVADTSLTPETTTATLTVGANTVSFAGNTEDSSIDGSTSNSWNTFDSITGGGGTDTLTATITAVNLRPNMSAVENLVLTDTGGATINMIDVTGLTSITSQTSTADVTINNLQSVGTLTMNNTTRGATVDYTAAATAGTSDEATLALEGVTGAQPITYTATTNTIETLNISSTISANTINDLQTTGAGVASIVVTGDQNLTIGTALDAEITSFDASAATGVQTLTLGTGGTTATFGTAADQITLGVATDNVTLGDGADTLFVPGGGALTTADTVAGGDGADTLQYTSDEAVALTDFTNVTGIETLTASNSAQMTGNLGAAADAAGIRTVTFNDDGDGDNLVVDAEFTSALTVNMDDGDNTLDASAYTGTLTVAITEAIFDAAADTHTITGGTGTSTLSLTADGTGVDNADMTTLTAFTNITIANDAATGTITLDELNIADGATLTIDATAITTAANGFTLDASDDTNGNLVVLGGAGVNTITGSSSDLGDNITGGASDDVLNFGATDLTTLDTVDGGDGSDTINYTADEAIALTDFTNVSNVEVLTSTNSVQMTGNLGAAADAAGIRTVTFNDDGDGDNLVIDAEFTSALTVNLDDGDNTLDASAYTGTLTVAITEAIADAAADTHTITGGTGTSTLSITADGTGIDNADMTTFTAFTNITIANDAASGTIVLDELNMADGATLTVDATAITTATNGFTLNAADDTNGSLVVLGGAGVNTITGSGSDLGDNITGGGSDDVFNFVTANLTLLDTIDGAGGTDSIVLTDDNTVVDADFTLVSNVETLTASADIDSTINVGTLAAAAGIVTITLTGEAGGDTDTVTVEAGYTGTLTVNLDDDAVVNSVDASASAATLSIAADDDELDTTANTLVGGTGTSDILTITTTGANTIAAADTANWSGIENITTAADAGTLSLELSDGNAAAGTTLTIDASSMATSAFTLLGANEADANLDVTAAGTGAHQITLGSGDDTYTSTSTGIDNVTATAGTNTITTGAGADTITMGTGADNITAGAGDDEITVATANFTEADTINGGDDTDSIIMSDDATIVDADFTLVSNVETLTGSGAGINLNVTLGALAAASGLATITVVDTSAADSITVGAGFTGALTVTVPVDTNAANTVNASASAAAITIAADDTDLDTRASTFTGGTGSSDEIEITVSGGTIQAADLANVTGFENITTVGNAGTISLTLNDANVAAGGSMTIDATSMTTTAATIVASGETDGTVTITAGGTGAHQITLGLGNDTYTSTSSGADNVTATGGNNTISTGAGDDTITLANGNDDVTAGDGDDTITVATNNLTANKTVRGGDGTDVLTLSNNAVVIDSDFTSITSVETLTAAANIELVATLGSNAADAGIVTITLTGEDDDDDSITFAAGYDATAVTVNLDADDANANTVDASASATTLTIAAADSELDSQAHALTGGSGGSDEIQVTVGGNAIAAADLANVSGFETITTVGNAGALSLTLNNANVAAGETLTINTESMTTTVATIVGTAEADGNLVITAGGTGAHQITLGSGNDSYTSTSSGADVVVATAGTNTISTGAGVDDITSGSGADTITVGAGTDNIVTLSTASLGASATDTITDWTSGTVEIEVDISELSAVPPDLDDMTTDQTAGDADVFTITGATDLGTAAATDGIVLVNLTGDVADTDALETALEMGGDAALTASGAIAVGDILLAAYTDGTDAYIAQVVFGSIVADNDTIRQNSLTATNLVKLTGIDDVTDIADGDVVFI